MSLGKEDIVIYYAGSHCSWDEATTNDNPTGGPIVLKFLYGWGRTSQRYTYADSFDGKWRIIESEIQISKQLICEPHKG